MTLRNRILRPRSPLRGPRLNEAALKELADLESWSAEMLTWANLAKRLNVSRQAIENKKKRPLVYEAFHKTKAALRGSLPSSPDAVAKRTIQDEINSLRDTIKAKELQLDEWAEKWAAVEFNAHRHGYNPDLLFAPLPSFAQG
jgi:hypothetical protein